MEKIVASVSVHLDDYEARIEAFKLFMSDRPQAAINWIRLAEYSECYTYAEIEHLVNEAARTALDARRNIEGDDIVEAITKNPATHTLEQIAVLRGSAGNNSPSA